MGNPHPSSFHFLLLSILTLVVLPIYANLIAFPNTLLPQNVATKLHFDPDSIERVSTDYGNLVRRSPSAVLHPSSIDDIIDLLKFSNNLSTPFPVSARGCGHSVRGQATARGGVVVDMSTLRNEIRVSWDPLSGSYYADVGGGRTWAEVLGAVLEHGVAPPSWTDYLHLSVGGTLSNGGISGQSFLHGPQISNVLEMDVVTGKGDFVTCSPHMNSELFFATLGGLGQFGIITRARLVLHQAPTRAKWVRVFYSDFSDFSRDQEYLITSSSSNVRPDYVEGSILTRQSPPNNWRSNSFYSSYDQYKIKSLLETSSHGILYSIELVKHYSSSSSSTAIDKEVEQLLRDLHFVPGFIFKKDVGFTDFLSRVEIGHPQREETHPWLNLFVPKSRVQDFNAGVLVDIIGRQNTTSGPILFYPILRHKWDDRMSAVTPDEEIFYTLGLLQRSGAQEWGEVERVNEEIMGFCERNGIVGLKQYLPQYKSEEDWMRHFGNKWDTFVDRKNLFDPRKILSRGQSIFHYYY